MADSPRPSHASEFNPINRLRMSQPLIKGNENKEKWKRNYTINDFYSFYFCEHFTACVFVVFTFGSFTPERRRCRRSGRGERNRRKEFILVFIKCLLCRLHEIDFTANRSKW